MSGGNWKDLVAATKDGDVEKMKYYLHSAESIDTSFQHPEYMTAPIFEAVRHNQDMALRLLIEHDKGDLAIVEDYSGLTPLETALEENKHDMVDVILSYTDLLPAKQANLVKSFLVLLSESEKSFEIGVVRKLLQQGHRVVISAACAPDQLLSKLVNETGNKKLHFYSKNDHYSYGFYAIIDLQAENLNNDVLNFDNWGEQPRKFVVLLSSAQGSEKAKTCAVEDWFRRKQYHSLCIESCETPVMFVLLPSLPWMMLDSVRYFFGMSTIESRLTQTISNLVAEPLPSQSSKNFVTFFKDDGMRQQS